MKLNSKITKLATNRRFIENFTGGYTVRLTALVSLDDRIICSSRSPLGPKDLLADQQDSLGLFGPFSLITMNIQYENPEIPT